MIYLISSGGVNCALERSHHYKRCPGNRYAHNQISPCTGQSQHSSISRHSPQMFTSELWLNKPNPLSVRASNVLPLQARHDSDKGLRCHAESVTQTITTSVTLVSALLIEAPPMSRLLLLLTSLSVELDHDRGLE